VAPSLGKDLLLLISEKEKKEGESTPLSSQSRELSSQRRGSACRHRREGEKTRPPKGEKKKESVRGKLRPPGKGRGRWDRGREGGANANNHRDHAGKKKREPFSWKEEEKGSLPEYVIACTD